MEKIQVLQQHQERLRSLNQQQYQDFKKKMELINQIQIETRSRLNEGEIPEKISEENEKKLTMMILKKNISLSIIIL